MRGLRSFLALGATAFAVTGCGDRGSVTFTITPPATPVSPTAVTAAASTWDGRFVVVANGSALTAFDTGSGKTMSGGLTLAFAPSRVVVAPRDQAIVALDPGTGSDGSLAIISDV